MPGLALAFLSTLVLHCADVSTQEADQRSWSPARYPWLAGLMPEDSPLEPLHDRFPTPVGLTRVAVDAGGFAAWLRDVPVRADRRTVLDYRGRTVPAAAAAVVALDLGDGDLQQCADTIIRLHAEFMWATGRSADAAYHFTSGHQSSWPAWLAGERFHIQGARVERLAGPARREDHATFRAWLQHLFRYSGTLSMALDSRSVGVDEAVAAGDFFVDPGSPGHAVMVLDVGVSRDGRRWGLVGQGYTPAQELHILTAAWPDVIEGVWFALPEGQHDTLEVPSWRPFARSTARRFTSF